MSDVPGFDEVPEGSAGARDIRVYGQVTLRLPAKGVGEPPAKFMRGALALECPDCHINVEVYWVDQGDPDDPFDHRGRWAYDVGHDPCCPWMATYEAELCPCGEKLHYSDPEIRAAVEAMIAAWGANQSVHLLGSGVWEVPRHFIALHGLKGSDLPELAERYGFRRIA